MKSPPLDPAKRPEDQPQVFPRPDRFRVLVAAVVECQSAERVSRVALF